MPTLQDEPEPTGPASAHRAPAVSVIVPAYNAARFIGQAVESVLNQSFQDFELIVVNDGSPDTAALERALQPYRDRIVYLAQPNMGPSGARNAGILRATGEYLAFLDSDDAWRPEFLATQMQIVSSDPAIDLVYSNGVIVGNVPLAGVEQMRLAPSRGDVTFDSIIGGDCTVLTSCVLVRRQNVIDAGLFDTRFRRSEDFHLWARLAYRGARIVCHRAVLVEHRQWPGSLSDDRRAMARAAIVALEELSGALSLTPSQSMRVRKHIGQYRAYLELDDAKRHFLAGAYAPAIAALGRSQSWQPARVLRVRLWLLQFGLRCAPGLFRWLYALRYPDLAGPTRRGGRSLSDLARAAGERADL